MLPPLPAAHEISITDTLALLDNDFAALAEGVERGEYALWLGSGISRARIGGLDGVLSKLIEFLRMRTTADPVCPFRRALDEVLELAVPAPEERALIDYSTESENWPCILPILQRLAGRYSQVLSIRVEGHDADYLLWDAVDFPVTFANLEPDAEHIAIGILALEGVFADIASANWDALLEAATRDLGHGLEFYRVCVTGDDFRGPVAAAKLYKFHGCAWRAITEEAVYRRLLIARQAQVAAWGTRPEFELMRRELTNLAARARTLMVGLSAQDPNIQHLFAQASAVRPWNWADNPPPHVFAEEVLQEGQKTILENSYGPPIYEPNRDIIAARARLRSYGKALLPALVLHVIAAKLIALMGTADAPNLDVADRTRLAEGIRHMRDLAAMIANGDRLEFMLRLARQIARCKSQLQLGQSPPGNIAYIPITNRAVHFIAGDPNLIPTGQREGAAGLGLIGLGAQEGHWILTADDPADARSGAVNIGSANGRARVILVAHSHNAVQLLQEGVYTEDDEDVVLLHSSDIVAPQQRSPSASLRTGRARARHLDMAQLLRNTPNLDELRQQFRQGVAL